MPRDSALDSGSGAGEGIERAAAFLQRVIDAVDAFVLVADFDGRVVLVNRTCVQSSGRAHEELFGQPFWSLFAPAEQESVQAAFEELAKGHVRTLVGEWRWPRRNLSDALLSWRGSYVTQPDRTPYVVATGTDVALHRRTERALAETEARYEALLDLSPDAVVVHQDRRIVFANRSAGNLFGASSPSDLLGRDPLDLVHPEDRPRVAARMDALESWGGSMPLQEVRNIRLDGELIDIEVTSAAVTFNGRRAIEYIARDIRPRKLAEAARRESEARIQAIFDDSSIGMLLLDRGGRCVAANRALQELLGYSATELASMSVRDYTHPADADVTGVSLREFFAGRTGSFEFEKRYIRKDGSVLWAHLHISPVRGEDGEVLYSATIMEDITARKILEDQIRQASKMEALGRLAGAVAHDFNNVLTVVNGYSELLAASLEGDERAADALEIRRQGGRAAELTQQLLAFGRRQPRVLQAVDLNGRIEAMLPMLGRLVGERINLQATLDDRIRAVQGDPSGLDQVVMNLVVNARDAMPSGGTLSISTSLTDGSEGSDDGVDGAGPRGWARLEIVDSGVGMKPEVLEHVFEPFFTTKELGRGTGLGLATVYGVVKGAGGRVDVESAPGAGSRFVVELPLSEASVFQPAPRGLAGPRRAGATILVVEDEPAVRAFCKRALEADGHAVFASGPEDAVTEAARLGDRLDLLLADVVMPSMDGPSLARALRVNHPALPVLFMSGYPSDDGAEAADPPNQGPPAGPAVVEGQRPVAEQAASFGPAESSLGANVIAKPFSQQELSAAVRRALEAA